MRFSTKESRSNVSRVCFQSAARIVLSFATLTASSGAQAQELPISIADLLREASETERETIENVARRLYPTSQTEIDVALESIEDEEKEKVGDKKFIEGWTGEGSLGASWSSGNTKEWSLSTSAEFKRRGPRWQHDFKFDTTLKDTDGKRTEERLRGNYRARLDFARSRWFVFGQLSYSRDLQGGIDGRFIEALGGGFQIVDKDKFSWEVSTGPGLRQTRFEDGSEEDQVGMFAATEMEWELSDTLVFREHVTAFLASSQKSFHSKTSLTSNLYGRLSGRLSFEAMVIGTPPTKKEVDTHASVSLVFAF